MKIPDYPESRAISLDDKPLLDKIFSQLQPNISEFTFAGLYLFREAHCYQLSIVGDSIVIFGKGYNGDAYFLPPLNGNISKTLKMLFDEKQILYGADDRFLSTYPLPEKVLITEERDSFDYLYIRNDLALLPGNRYHKKKNRINYFTKRHQYELVRYSEILCNDCITMLNNWLKYVDNGSNLSLGQEVLATSEALRNSTTLGLEGVVIIANDSVAAFALGEKLNQDTAVCHFEKSDPFKEGLPQLVNREFARLLFTECHYINREQDLGESGLRNAKLSYHPVELIKKYRVTAVRS